MAVGAWGAVVIVIPFATLPAIIGMCGMVAMPDASPNGILFAMSNAQGPVVAGVVSMSIAAAIWSSAPAALLFISNTLTQDLYAVVRPQSGAARYRGHMARAQCVIHPGSTVRCVSDTLGCGNRVVGIHGVAARVQYGCVLVHVAGRHRRCRMAFRRQPSGHGAFVARMWHHHRRIAGIDACQQDKGLRRVRALQRGARRACSS